MHILGNSVIFSYKTINITYDFYLKGDFKSALFLFPLLILWLLFNMKIYVILGLLLVLLFSGCTTGKGMSIVTDGSSVNSENDDSTQSVPSVSDGELMGASACNVTCEGGQSCSVSNCSNGDAECVCQGAYGEDACCSCGYC